MHRAVVDRLLFPMQEWLKGKPTFAMLRELEKTQWLDAAALHELQFRALRRHLEFAYREVPYYTRLLDEHELQPHRIQSFADFTRIPYLTRDDLRRCFTELRPRRRLRGVQAMSTGGSTGSPVTVLVDRERAAVTDAIRLRCHRWYDAGPGTREIALWGSPIESNKQDRVRTLRDHLINSKFLSAFDLGEATLARYAQVVRQYRPQKLFGYASALALLAGYLHREGWRPEPGQVRAVFATAEPLYDFQRALIGSVFGCPVSVEYGCRDAALMATECPSGGLHIPVEAVTVEILPTPGDPDRDRGEIVVTNTHSYAMPIIRYRTGDIGAFEPTACGCGRALPRLKSVEGRRTDFLVTPGGKVMHALAAIYVLREVPGIRQFQLIQERLDLLRVTVAPDPGFPAAAPDQIVAKLERLFDGQIAVELELVPSIPPLPSGKHRYVISRVADAHFEALTIPGV
ncbi:MAG TPA: phenylacetate--CoA ligase family protein [Methylomirabilota bacterium]